MKLIVAIVLFGLYSCSENPERRQCRQDSIILDIPTLFRDSSYVIASERILNTLNLPLLTNGFDQMQIRIWYGYPYSNRDHLVMFSKESGKWNGEIWIVEYLSKASDGIDTATAYKKQVTPKCGWSLLMDSLMSNELLTLKDCDSVPGYNGENNGQNFTVEFANCEIYRIYHYADPWLNADNFEGAKKVTKINEIIERQLSFQRLYTGK